MCFILLIHLATIYSCYLESMVLTFKSNDFDIQNKISCLMINDIDAGLGRFGEYYDKYRNSLYIMISILMFSFGIEQK